MGKFGKSFLSQVISDGIKGPFVTIMLNTHVGHQNVEKDQIKFKNLAKDAKRRFEKKYPDHSWDLFQTKIDVFYENENNQKRTIISISFQTFPLILKIQNFFIANCFFFLLFVTVYTLYVR